MEVSTLLEKIRASQWYHHQIVHVETIQPREALFASLSHPLHPDLEYSLAKKGIKSLYIHQVRTIENVRAGRHTVVVTPTASGKSMCYNLPVF